MMLTVVLSPGALAQWEDTNGYYMWITYGAGSYQVGDDVDVVVHVFDRGDYADVDNLTFMVGDIFGGREVELTKGATGKWSGTFTIEPDDVDDSYGAGMVYLIAEGEVNGSSVEDTYNYISLTDPAGEQPLMIVTTTVDPPSAYMDGGEMKTITWRCYYDGNLVDPSDMEVEMYEGSGWTTITPDKESTGVYSYEYTMPSDPFSMSVNFDFWAEYEVAPDDVVEGDAEIDLFKVYFHVWAKKDAVSATTASFDLYISNGTGGPVEAAVVDLSYDYHDDSGDYMEKETSATTDADGIATINLAYNDLGSDEEYVHISGTVKAQGFEQNVEFDLQVRSVPDEGEDPEPEGLDVINSRQSFTFDKSVNMPADAYFDGEPLASSTVYWYAHTQHAVLNKGSATTNVQGGLSLDFSTPGKGQTDPLSLLTHYETPVVDGDTTYYYEDDEYGYVTSMDIEELPDNPWSALEMFQDSAVKISYGKLEKGKDVPVTVEYSGADEEWTVAVMLSNDPNPSSMGLVPKWTYWTESFMQGMYSDLASPNGNKYQTTIFIPENLPNKDFYVAALLMNQHRAFTDMDFKSWIKTRYVDGLEVGESGTSGDDGEESIMDTLMDTVILGIPLLYWLFIIIILVIVGVVGARLARRRGEARALEEPSLEPTEGPQFDGDLGPSQMPMPAPVYDQMQAVPGQAEYAPQPQPVDASQPQPEYAPPPQAEYAPPPQAGYAPPPQAGYAPPPQAEYAPPPQAEYASPPQPEYPPPPPAPTAPMAPEQPMAPPPASTPPQPAYAPPAAAPPAPAAPVQPSAPPPAPAVPAAPVAPPAPAPAAVPPPAVAPAAPAPDAGATMTIRCQKCQTTLTIPRKRPIKVTCPNCGASGVLR